MPILSLKVEMLLKNSESVLGVLPRPLVSTWTERGCRPSRTRDFSTTSNSRTADDILWITHRGQARCRTPPSEPERRVYACDFIAIVDVWVLVKDYPALNAPDLSWTYDLDATTLAVGCMSGEVSGFRVLSSGCCFWGLDFGA